MNIICKKCKNQIKNVPYIYDIKIITENDRKTLSDRYYAVAKLKTICEYCGTSIEESVQSEIIKEDIVDHIKEHVTLIDHNGIITEVRN